MRLGIFLFLFFLAFNLSFAQLKNQFYIEPSLHFGQIVKHKEEINFPVSGPSYGFEINAKWQTRGNKHWHEWQKYPSFGLEFLAYRLGDKDVLGSAIGLIPNMTLHLMRGEKWSFNFQMGTGIAYLNRPFHINDNPLNNAIGSFVNNTTSVKFYFERKLQNALSANVGLVFTHFSNGGTKLPNLGINIPMLSLGVRYDKNRMDPKSFYKFGQPKKTAHKLGYTLSASLAFQEIRVPGGPIFPVYVGSVGLQYKLNKVNRLVLGYEYEFNRSMHFFGYHVFIFDNKKEAFQGASRHMLYVGDEFLFGDWSLQLQTGFYVFDKNALLIPFPNYFKLTTRYYFPIGKELPFRSYAGIVIKSHLFVADYLALTAGVSF